MSEQWKMGVGEWGAVSLLFCRVRENAGGL